MTGPIQPFPIPDVTPSYFAQNTGQDRLQRSFQALLAVLQGRQEIEAQRAQQAQQSAAGDMLGTMLADIGTDTVPGITVPGIAGTPGYTTQPFKVEGPLTAFRGKPGLAVYEAVRTGQNIIGPEVARISRAREKAKADPWTSGEVDIRPVGPNHQLMSFNKKTGRVTPFLKPDGSPATEPPPDPAQAGGSFIPLTDEETGRVFAWNPKTRQVEAAPQGLTKAGQITESERRSAQLYSPAARAFKELDKRNFGNLSFDQAFLVFKALRGDSGALAEPLVRKLLTPENRLIVSLYAELIGNIAYSKSGANVNEREFASQRQLIPFLDDGQGRTVKRQVLMDNLTGMYGSGYRQLQLMKRHGLKWTPIEDLIGADAKPIPTINADEADLLNDPTQ